MPEMTSGLQNFEESDQLVLLNAFDVVHKNSNTTHGVQMFSSYVQYTFRKTKKEGIYTSSTLLGRQKKEDIYIWMLLEIGLK